MTYQDQRNEEHPEAVRSDPVPVQRSAPDDELTTDTDRDGYDADGDGVDDRTDAERGFHENATDEPEPGHEDGYQDNVTADTNTDTETDTDVDRDGVDDRVEDGETDADEETEDERTGYDEPVIASPVDTEVERNGVDGAEFDRDRAADDDDRTYDGPTFPDSAMTPVAFGAAAAGGAAALAANRTDDRTDTEHVEADGIGDDRTPDDVAVVATDDDEPTELMPGEVDAEPVTALVAVESAQGFRDRWREVQLRFVDDPRGAAAEAQGLAEEAADALVAALDSLRNDLGGWEASEAADTEHLRVVVRRYRDFLDRMLQS
ncbi:hypothetical protein Ais01nite_69670 [Asanoa ishikariensis]|uniref:Uncharacterized protein n=1 Tax=Asanoa ishikariensis TaxID=137265 RepID=A0A1H3N0K4_9ACTN|nr:hypothetical protein [Asanoa ishikariensis]GIF68932.1 hypothetical protein Ais01nite_69670 [Asanoa ishikariensis]SDY82376.1 hypothetical protein SAMN05421684_1738 [Asanoa ishikariensis]